MDRSALGWLVYQVARRAGLHAHPHAIRRSLATRLLRAGASVEAIRHLLGHTSLAATDHYLALDKADLRKAVELLEGQALLGGW